MLEITDGQKVPVVYDSVGKDTFMKSLDVVLTGAVKFEVILTYPLKDVARAHRDVEARKTTGSTVLTVERS